jgi:hypothetical protein
VTRYASEVRIAVLAMIALASSRAAAEPCRGTRVEVTSPTDTDRRAGNVATLSGSFAGPGAGRDVEWTCLVTRDGEQSVHGRFTVELVASRRELQRIAIGGSPILIHIPPRGELHVAYHPCVFWELFALWLDGATVDPPDSIAVDNKRACPKGYIEGGHIVEAARQDEAQHARRCVRSARLALDTSTRRTLKFVDRDDTLAPGSTIDWAPYGGICPHLTTVDTGSEKIDIAPGVGERWRLTIDTSGKLRGSL